MTLILTHYHDISGLLTLSDLALSSSAGERRAITIPFRDRPFVPPDGNSAVQDFCQKTVIFNRTLVQFSGRLIVATAFLKSLREKSDDGRNDIAIEEAFSDLDLLPSEKEAVSLIRLHQPLGAPLIIDHHGCFEFDQRGMRLIGQGSGSGYFLDNLTMTATGEHPEHVNIRHEIIAKAVSHSLIERSGTETLEQLYGAWFEFAFALEDGFAKLPYGIKLWARKNGQLASGGPAFLAWYSSHDLVVTRFQPQDLGGGKTDMKLTHFRYPDLLGRPSGDMPPPTRITPEFVAHIIQDEDDDVAIAMIDMDPSQKTMLFSVGPEGPEYKVSTDHFMHLQGLKPGTDGATLTRAWDLPGE